MFNEYGIILKTVDYKDKDKLLTIFTVHGVITITAKGVRTITSKLKSSCTVMTLANFSYVFLFCCCCLVAKSCPTFS